MDLRVIPSGWRPPAIDIAVALGLTVVGLGEVWFLETAQSVGALPGALVVVALSVPLAWRRRAPLASCLAVFGTLLLAVVLVVPIDGVIFFIPILVLALYSVAAHTDRWRAGVGLAFALVATWVSMFTEDGPGLDNLLFGLVVATAPWLAGRLVRTRTDKAEELALRAHQLEHSQAEREGFAVAQERARIARELHDVIAHSVSVMTIQAGAIEAVVDTDPGKARAAAAAIRRAGQQAQTDLRHLLGLLREQPPEGEKLAPQPGLADLDRLVDSVTRAGVTVGLSVQGAPQPLPAAVDLSAFRVVQEALTNVLKHAGASTASVGVRYGAGALDIEVTDDGDSHGEDLERGAPGHGLVGMRERVALFGGHLEYGRSSCGGFRVHAVLPIDGPAR